MKWRKSGECEQESLDGRRERGRRYRILKLCKHEHDHEHEHEHEEGLKKGQRMKKNEIETQTERIPANTT